MLRLRIQKEYHKKRKKAIQKRDTSEISMPQLQQNLHLSKTIQEPLSRERNTPHLGAVQQGISGSYGEEDDRYQIPVLTACSNHLFMDKKIRTGPSIHKTEKEIRNRSGGSAYEKKARSRSGLFFHISQPEAEHPFEEYSRTSSLHQLDRKIAG